MHRKIVEAIKYVIESSPMSDNCDIYVKSKKTDGLWGMAIVIKEERSDCIPHIEGTALRIGRMHGEGLNIQTKERVITIN